MNPDPIRFSTNPPDNRPPDGFVELNWDAEAGVLALTDAEGNKSPVGGVTTDSVLDALEGQSITVDYIGTADNAGNTIPDYAFSRKGAVPYFGNSPIGTGEVFARGAISGTSTGSPARFLLCSVAIPAEAMEAGSKIHIDLDFFGRVSTSNSGAWGLMFALDDATDPLDGVLVQFGDSSGTNIRLTGYLEIIGGLMITGTNLNGALLGSELADTAISALHGKVLFGGDGIFDNITEPSAAASINHISIYLIDISATSAQSCTAQVKIAVLVESE